MSVSSVCNLIDCIYSRPCVSVCRRESEEVAEKDASQKVADTAEDDDVDAALPDLLTGALVSLSFSRLFDQFDSGSMTCTTVDRQTYW